MLNHEVLKDFSTAGIKKGFAPPWFRRPGGVVWDIGAGSKAEGAELFIRPWRPQELHFFEPVPQYFAEVKADLCCTRTLFRALGTCAARAARAARAPHMRRTAALQGGGDSCVETTGDS